ETLAQAQEETQAWLTAWLAGETPAEPQWPSVAFGTSCALAELDGSLPQAGDYRTVPLCSGDPDDLFAALNAMPGEKIAKVKVGLYESVRDGMIVNMLLEALPDLKLRLDANRAWTRAKAEGFAKYVNPDYRPRIQFLEEPCKTPQESLDYAQYTGINIAWDETVRDEGFEVQAQDGVSAIVIKPTLVGSLQRCQMLVEQAHAAGLIAVISSSIESSLGLTQLARVAAWLTPDTMPGLDTLSMMQAQVLRPWPDSALPLWPVSQLEKVWPW
ncbi:MAG: o-succinylbenzoate synthase, partial [Plesiomonas shigelloides]